MENESKSFGALKLLIIPYLFFSGGLYHIAYWSTFDLNGLSYIGVSDIIKSFIYPFINFGFLFFFSAGFTEIMLRSELITGKKKATEFMPIGGGRSSKLGIFLNSGFGLYLSASLWIFAIGICQTFGPPARWIVWASIVALGPILFLMRGGLFETYFANEYQRLISIRFLFYVPIFAFASGKYESELIHRNLKYKYIANPTNIEIINSMSTDTMKFVGHTEKYACFTDLNNSKIFFINTDKIDVLTLIDGVK